jgi:hypothetical protein
MLYQHWQSSSANSSRVGRRSHIKPKPKHLNTTMTESVASSIVGSVVDVDTSASNRILNFGLIEKLKLSLARDAAAKTVLNGTYNGKPVVMSPHIKCMISAYRASYEVGKVVVMCSPGNSGKSSAARFLIHGEHPARPQRSLIVSAKGMVDFALQFSELLGVKSASAESDEHLCIALTQISQDSSAAAGLVLKAGDLAESSLCFATNSRRSFTSDRPIKMHRPEKIRSPRKIGLGEMPVLIIDDFNKATEENKSFVEKLLQSAAPCGVLVFILTEKRDWATTLVGLNGGRKIKPLHGNVNHADYTPSRNFTGVPDWNSLQWPVETLRELILPRCETPEINPVKVVPDGAVMTPDEAIEELQFLLAAPDNS